MGNYTDNTKVKATEENVAGDLADGHVVILSLKQGFYYGLNPVGARIWSLIQEPIAVGEIRRRLMAQYEVDADRCNREVNALLEALASHGLLEAVPAPTP